MTRKFGKRCSILNVEALGTPKTSIFTRVHDAIPQKAGICVTVSTFIYPLLLA
jgi:hypothetical protein